MSDHEDRRWSNEIRERLIAEAREAALRSYSPYSKFAVGAALLVEDGRVFRGCNVENASYGLTTCAERVAIFKAISEGATVFLAIAIFTPTDRPTPPCGACRQVLNEFGSAMPVVMACHGPGVTESSVEALLPEAFGPENF